MHDDKILLDCDRCNGTGKEKFEPDPAKTGEAAYRKCPACNGTGMIEISWHEYERMREREDVQDDH